MEPRLVVVPSEPHIQSFTGSHPQELIAFLEDLEALWVQRPDLSDEQRGRRVWQHLISEVKEELRCQGLSPNNKYQEMNYQLCPHFWL